MDVYEITGYITGQNESGVNFLQIQDSFQSIFNGFINRQVLQSRQGFSKFGLQNVGTPVILFTRILGIFENILPDGSQQLLVATEERLYIWDQVTDIWLPIPFGGSMAAYTGFNNNTPDLYISGVSYSTKNNTQRFVFTGEGIALNANGSAIFFYDGTDVKDFTNDGLGGGDNPDYRPPLYPVTNVTGKLLRATYVTFFGERLNFGAPTLSQADLSGVITYDQGILFSGIRNGAGNGDKFNIPGSGLIQADTNEVLTGVTVRGQILVLNFSRSNWVLEKTQDAFNPYFIRKVPSVLGTNAKFSAVLWEDIVSSMGKTGVIATDGRQSLRIDTKIPEFTRDAIDSLLFNLTYGGFDRINNQFLWSYLESGTENTTVQNKCLVQNYNESSWSTFDFRFSVFGQTDLGQNRVWDQIDETSGNAAWADWDTTEEIWDRIGIGAQVQKTLAGDDLGIIWQLNTDYDDFFEIIQSITTGATTIINCNKASFLPGDLIVVQSVNGVVNPETGDSAINNFDPTDNFANMTLLPYTVISVDQTPLFTTNIEINLDTTIASAYIDGGFVSKIINFRAETIPFNPYRGLGLRCYVSHVDFYLETNGGNLLVDVYANEDDLPFKNNIIIFPTSQIQKGEWVSMVVDNEADFHTFVLKQNSVSVQLRLKSMRIYCTPGGMTNG